MRRLHLVLLLAVLVILLLHNVREAAGGPTIADRVLALELRMDELGRQHSLLIGLIVADLLSTLALLKRGRS